MNYRMLGKDLRVSAVGLGCMGFSHAYGPVTDDTEAISAVHAALDLGYTFFDTAEVYGPYINEEMLGKALKGRHDAVIATKFGVRLEQGSVGAPIPNSELAGVRKSLEGSLRRLGVECIDLYYQHRIDPKVAPEEIASLMAEFIQEGKIRHWGISLVDEDYLRRAHAVCPVTAVQNRYSMMARQDESLFPFLEELHIAYVAYSPLANGFLSGAYGADQKFGDGDYRGMMPQFTAQGMKENHRLLQFLTDLGGKKGATPAQIALAWMLCKKPYIVPIPGTRNIQRMAENAAASDIELTPQDVRDIDDALDHMPMSAVYMGWNNR